MKDKVVLITGANGGLGVSVTRAFAQTGARVIGAARKINAGDFAQPNLEALAADLAKPDQAQRTIAHVIERYGRLDVLAHVMGAFAGGQPIAETTDATWQQMQDTNLTSAFYVFREAIPHLRKAGAGRLIAIGSLTAAHPVANLGAYVTFKAALAMLVQTIAAENGDAGMTANVILPGTMDTPANRQSMPKADFSKWLKTDDVAELVLTLAKDTTGRLNGLAIPIEGSHA
jgi:NAD(P)-dependent dehydrogenase (short-subunit alcohol dehydrogenase family)